MKKVLFVLLLASFIGACGKNKTGKQLAEEVCECSRKANDMDLANPKRTESLAECTRMNQEAWSKVKDDDKKADEFNAVISKCASEQIKKAFGE